MAGLKNRVVALLTVSEDPGRRGAGFLWLAAALLVGVAGAAGVYVAVSGVSVQASSSGLVKWSATIMTSMWTYLAVIVVVGWGVLFARDEKKANAASEHTGLRKRTVKRLAAEMKSTAGTTRVLVDSTDSAGDVEDAISRKLDGEGPDSTAIHPTLSADISASSHADSHGDEDAPDIDSGSEDSGESDGEVEITAADRWRAWKLDTVAALNRDDLVWYFAVPAVVVAFAAFMALGIWVHPVVAVAIGAGSAAIGASNLIRVRRKRLKTIGKFREETTQRPVDTAAVLVKRVDTPEMTVYAAWVAGHRFASPDRDEFVTGVAERAVSWTRDEGMPPSIMTRFARELESFRPDLAAYRDFEKHRVARALVDEIEDARIAPRGWVIESVVEDRLDETSPERVLGHDPGIVHEMYDLLTPEVLVEEPLTVPDSDGTERDVVAVRLRGDPVRPGDAASKARFNGVFNSYTEGGESVKYGVPDVDPVTEPDVRVPTRDAADIDYEVTNTEA